MNAYLIIYIVPKRNSLWVKIFHFKYKKGLKSQKDSEYFVCPPRKWKYLLMKRWCEKIFLMYNCVCFLPLMKISLSISEVREMIFHANLFPASQNTNCVRACGFMGSFTQLFKIQRYTQRSQLYANSLGTLSKCLN